MQRDHRRVERGWRILCCLGILLAGMLQGGFARSRITDPETFFGFPMGADRQLARWDRMVEYFVRLEKESPRLKVLDMGNTGMGNPFLVLIISAPENLARLDALQKINHAITDPGEVPESELSALVEEGRAVICQSMGLHATEVGGTQMTPELAFHLLSRDDPATRRILEEVLFFMIPCFNPDGQVMVTDWYRKTRGTAHEGISLPWLYHPYAGHDNNRDGDFLNLVESRYAARILYLDWPPQAYIDHHQMGSYGPRFYVPPYCEPIRPYADPLVWREISWYGSHIATRLEQEGFEGVINDAMFPGWGHFGWHWITPFHNIAGMLTESASARLATPIYIHPDQLRADSRQFPEYEAQSNFPSPWPGGWWRLADIVAQKKTAALALLDHAAKNRRIILENAILKARHQTERGAAAPANVLVIPSAQHDRGTAAGMIRILLQSGVKIHRLADSRMMGERKYPPGSWVIPMGQPKMGLIRNLLMQTRYSDNRWTRAPSGHPLEPYDLATHTMHEFMGVRVDPVRIEGFIDFPRVTAADLPAGEVKSAEGPWVLDGRRNDSYRAVNLLIDRGVKVFRLHEPAGKGKTGDFVIHRAEYSLLAETADACGVTFDTLPGEHPSTEKPVQRSRLGLFRRYYGGNMDEGWTRLTLEQFDFPYRSVRGGEIDRGQLNRRYDTLVFPHDLPALIKGVIPERYRRWIPTDIPAEYRSAISARGIENLVTFVRSGGCLVAFGGACNFAIEELDLQVTDVTADFSAGEFFCPGSTLKVNFDPGDPLAYGMPEEALVLFYDSPVFRIRPGSRNRDYVTVGRYREKEILQSGWLIGEEKIGGMAAMVRATVGKGEVVLIGFRPQHRCQTHGTFKLLFNCLLR